MTSAVVSPSLVARVLGKSVRTVTGWCVDGVIPGAEKTPSGGSWLIPRAFIAKYLSEESAESEKTEARQ